MYLVMYFTVNVAFVNYFDNIIQCLGIPVLRNWTTQEHILTLSVESFEINASLPNAPKMLKQFVNQYENKKKILELQEHKDEERNKQDPCLVLSSTVFWQIYFSSQLHW